MDVNNPPEGSGRSQALDRAKENYARDHYKQVKPLPTRRKNPLPSPPNWLLWVGLITGILSWLREFPQELAVISKFWRALKKAIKQAFGRDQGFEEPAGSVWHWSVSIIVSATLTGTLFLGLGRFANLSFRAEDYTET